MEKKSINEIEVCPVKQLVWRLAIPSIVAELVNIIYNIVDRIFLGRIEGEGPLALAGLGIAIPLITILDAFIFWIGNGGAPLAAIAMGQKDMKRAQRIIGNSWIMLIVLAVLATFILLVKGEDLLTLFGADADTLPYAKRYLSIYALGTPGSVAALGLNPFITTQGKNRISMRNVALGAIINCILDPIFIYGFHMGIAGAAVATIIGQYVTAILTILYLLGKETKLKLKIVRPVTTTMGQILALGLSIFFIYITQSVVSIVFYRLLTRYGDYRYVTVLSILESISQIFIRLVRGTGQGAQPIMSYSFGAGNLSRLRETTLVLATATGVISFVMTGMALLFPHAFFRIFTHDEEIITLGSGCLRMFLWGQCVLGFQLGLQEMFRSIGFTKISMFVATVRKLVLIIPMSLIFTVVMDMGVKGVFLAEGISDFTGVVITLLIYAAVRKHIGIKTKENLLIRQELAICK